MVYNSTLDEYVYRDIEEEGSSERSWWRVDSRMDPSTIEEYRNNEKLHTPKISAGLYRKCSCHDDGFNSLGDEWNQLCPLEAQTCAMIYLDDEKHENHSSPSQATTLCYTMNPRVGIIRHTWPILWFWLCLLTVILVMSEAGRQAIHYGIIRTCGAFCCVWSCLLCCCCTDDDSFGRNDFVADFGEAYNSFLIRRMLRGEARRRGIRLSRWEVLRERLAIERGDFATEEQDAASPRASMAAQSRRHTNQQWLGEWRGVRAATVASQRRIDEWLRQRDGDDDEEGGEDDVQGSRGADTDLSQTRRRMRRKYGIQDLTLRTKIFCKADYICKSSGNPSREDDPEQPAITVAKSDSDDESAGGKTDTSSSCNHQDEEDDEVDCIICFGPLEDGDKVGDLPHCSHLFHASCLKTWIERKNTCPMCLKPIAKSTTSSFRVRPDGSIISDNR